MKWGPNEPPTFKTEDPWKLTAAIAFESQITIMLDLDF